MTRPFIARTVEANGFVFRALHWAGASSDAPTVVFHHATGFNADLWQPVVDALDGAVDAWAYDRRGHGQSSQPESGYDFESVAQDAIGLYRALNLRPALSVGHSAGSSELLFAASLEPELFEQLLVIEPIIIPPALQAVGGANPMAEKARRRHRSFESESAWRREYRDRPPFASWVDSAIDGYLSGGFETHDDGSLSLRCHPETEAAMFEESMVVDPTPFLRSIAVPVTVVLGANSGQPFHMFAEYLFEHCAHAKPEEADGCTHFVPMERPDLVAHRVLSLLEGAA